MTSQADISGAFQRPSIVDYLIVAELEERSVVLEVHVGALEVGSIGVSGGRAVHAELPGATGETALALLTRLPKARVMAEPWSARVTNIERSWRHLVDEAQLQASPGRSQRLAQVRAEYEEIESEGEGAQLGSEPRPEPELNPELEALAAILDWAGVEAYLGGDLERARTLLGRRDALVPGDLMCAANLERLRLRLLEDEISSSLEGVAE